LGLRRAHPRLFEDVTWNTDRVYVETVERAKEINLPALALPAWYDVDDQISLSRLLSELFPERANEAVPRAHPLRAPKNSCAKFWQVKVPAESGRGRPPRRELYDLWRSTNPELGRKTSAEDVDRTRDSLVDPSAGLRQGVSQQMNIEVLGILLSTAKPKHARTRGRRSRSPSEGGRWMTFRPSHWRAEKSEEINRHIGDTRGGAKIAPCPNNCSPSFTNSRWCFGRVEEPSLQRLVWFRIKGPIGSCFRFTAWRTLFANRGVAPRNSLDGKW
jgi:hypothetical protein